jgi:hypothetical protein
MRSAPRELFRLGLYGSSHELHRGLGDWQLGLWPDPQYRQHILDMNPDKSMAAELRRTLESDGDRVADPHVWRLGPGHLGAIVSILTSKPRDADFYRSQLSRFRMLSHLTIEVRGVAAHWPGDKISPGGRRMSAPLTPVEPKIPFVSTKLPAVMRNRGDRWVCQSMLPRSQAWPISI